MRNGWDEVDSNLEKTGNENDGICSKFQINWMRNGWDKVDSNLEKTGNEIEFNRKWTITFPVFEVNIL